MRINLKLLLYFLFFYITIPEPHLSYSFKLHSPRISKHKKEKINWSYSVGHVTSDSSLTTNQSERAFASCLIGLLAKECEIVKSPSATANHDERMKTLTTADSLLKGIDTLNKKQQDKCNKHLAKLQNSIRHLEGKCKFKIGNYIDDLSQANNFLANTKNVAVTLDSLTEKPIATLRAATLLTHSYATPGDTLKCLTDVHEFILRRQKCAASDDECKKPSIDVQCKEAIKDALANKDIEDIKVDFENACSTFNSNRYSSRLDPHYKITKKCVSKLKKYTNKKVKPTATTDTIKLTANTIELKETGSLGGSKPEEKVPLTREEEL